MPLIPNGHNNTLVGHKFDPGNEMSLPSELQDATRRERRLLPLTYEQKKIRADELTAYWAIAETCKKCKRPLIASEVADHYANDERLKNKHGSGKGA